MVNQLNNVRDVFSFNLIPQKVSFCLLDDQLWFQESHDAVAEINC